MTTLPAEGTTAANPVHIYTDGIFDCFHYGHAKVWEQCKKLFPFTYLVVGVCSDSDTSDEKAKPIMTAEERVECVKHCKWADEVIINAPWVCSLEFLDSIGCKYIAHDPAPYPFNDVADWYACFKEAGRFLPTRRTEGISTTDIIKRVLKNYDAYIERSIKKGETKEDLSISGEKYASFKLLIIVKKIEKRKKVYPVRFYLNIWKVKINARDN